MRNQTKIVMILDRSGSMSSVKGAMEEVLNGYIAIQRGQKDLGECIVSLVQFDDAYEVIFTNKRLEDVPQICLEPRGSTALLDALGKTIDSVGVELSYTPEAQRPSKVLFVVITDGLENCSREYVSAGGNKMARISEMVKHQRERYSWEFVFLGANQDAIASACSMGFSAGSAVGYTNDAAGIKGFGAKLSRMSSSYRSISRPEDAKLALQAANAIGGQQVTSSDTEEWDEQLAAQTKKDREAKTKSEALKDLVGSKV